MKDLVQTVEYASFMPESSIYTSAEKIARITVKNMITGRTMTKMFENMIVDYGCSKECCNPENIMKYTCYKCGKCGRKFNGQVMVDDGGTTPEGFDEE